MRTIIQRKQVKRHLVFVLDAKTNRFIRNRLEFKSATNGLRELVKRATLEQTKHFDVLPHAEF